MPVFLRPNLLAPTKGCASAIPESATAPRAIRATPARMGSSFRSKDVVPTVFSRKLAAIVSSAFRRPRGEGASTHRRSPSRRFRDRPGATRPAFQTASFGSSGSAAQGPAASIATSTPTARASSMFRRDSCRKDRAASARRTLKTLSIQSDPFFGSGMRRARRVASTNRGPRRSDPACGETSGEPTGSRTTRSLTMRQVATRRVGR